MRVSSQQQNGALQDKAIRQWAEAKGVKVKFYRDKFTGKTMNRPGWSKMDGDMRAGKIDVLICWKLDRLGRTTRGLCELFDFCMERKINLVSITEGLDLSTPAGRWFARNLASAAEYETEIRGERVMAGQAIARAKGVKWGGSKKGWTKLTDQQIAAMRKLHETGTSQRAIASMMKLSWPTVHKVVKA